MNDLIEKLERATEPNRVLDGLIFMAVYQRDEDHWTTFGDDEVWHRQDPKDRVAFDAPPAYTLSVDAALGLIPHDLTFALMDYQRPPEVMGFVYRRHKDVAETEQFSGRSENPAIALCIAALKARSHSSTMGEKS